MPTELTPEQKRIAIAECCGWTEIERNPFHPNPPLCGFNISQGKTPEQNCGSRWGIPDYLNSLDAMAQAEATLSYEEADRFDCELYDICKRDNSEREYPMPGRFAVIHATASQRAEAFLKVKGIL